MYIKTKNASGREIMVPRSTMMTEAEIAKAIIDAPDWSAVDDLLQDIADDIGGFSDGWEDRVDKWCTDHA